MSLTHITSPLVLACLMAMVHWRLSSPCLELGDIGQLVELGEAAGAMLI
jgi:hypothetical protein